MARRLKILLFVETFSNPTETFVYNQVVGLAEQHEVEVVCWERKKVVGMDYDRVHTFPHGRSFWLEKWRNLLRRFDVSLRFYDRDFAQGLAHFCQTFRPDLIHCHFGIQALIFLDHWPDKNIPIFITFHGYDASQQLQQSAAYRKHLRQVLAQDHIHCLFVSQALYQKLAQWQIPVAHAEVLYLGIDPHFFHRSSPTPEDTFRFLQVSSFTEKKGQEYTLRAFKLFRERFPQIAVELVLGGEGPLRPTMQDLAKNLGIQDVVRFPGLLQREQVRTWMEKARVFVHHSVEAKDGNTEGLPTVILEAMAMELPILATRHSGIPEAVTDGVHGFLVAEKDMEAMAERMGLLLDWSLLPTNRTTILEHFSQERHLSKLLAHYQSVLPSAL